MALFLYLAGAAVEAIETTHRRAIERDGEDRAISRQHEYRTMHGLDRAGAAGDGGVG